MSEDVKEEKLDSPLIVHKKSDSSYQETDSILEMNETHIDEDEPTLERHRFKKDPNKKNHAPLVVVIIIVVLVAIFAGLYFTGNITFNSKDNSRKNTSTTQETTTSLQDAYKGTIVVKGTYIFVDGIEVDGINGLQNALKYLDPSPTAFTIIKEDANDEFLNYDILPLLTDMGFYDESTDIQMKKSTGLMSENEVDTTVSESATSSTTTNE
jgi:hypothetical protein